MYVQKHHTYMYEKDYNTCIVEFLAFKVAVELKSIRTLLAAGSKMT